ncbi:MAG: hypothetical protein U0271_44455 [Polyangiaceae bacterium]
MTFLASALVAFTCSEASAQPRVADSEPLRASFFGRVPIEGTNDAVGSFAFDVDAGVHLFFGEDDHLTTHPGLVIVLEAGYSGTPGPVQAFAMNPGIGYGNAFFYVTYESRALIGAYGPRLDPLFGARNSLVAHGLLDTLTLQVSHEVLVFDGAAHQSILVGGGLNLLSTLTFFRNMAWMSN